MTKAMDFFNQFLGSGSDVESMVNVDCGRSMENGSIEDLLRTKQGKAVVLELSGCFFDF